MTMQVPQILYNNRYDDGTPTASATDSGYSVLNIKDWRTYTYWQATGAGPFYLTIDCGSAKTADALGIISHNLYTVGATVSVECSSDNFSSDTTVALTGFQPTNNKVIYKNFTSISKRYWRLKIALGSSQSPRVGICCIGNKFAFPYGVTPPYDPTGQKVHAEANSSQSGNLLGAVIAYTEMNIKPQWNYLDPTWIKNNFDTFWETHASQHKPFFWAWDIGDHNDEIFLVSITQEYSLSRPYETDIRRSLSLDLVGIKEI